MQSESRFFDDLVKVLNGAAGTVAGMTREAEAGFRERMRDWVGGLDMVGRDEFEAVKAIAVAAREESMALKARLDAFETAAAAEAAAPAAPKPRRPRAAAGPGPDAKRGE
ncbi:MAG TPA: accessory factor UbiK family protein [Allosphingosinicella sp.]|nr:accessory factor UbiK family protein [Allosphingosinicella sp.]